MSQYIPKPDAEGINSPAQGTPVKDAIILVAGFLSFVAIVYFVSGFVTEKVISKISIESETKFFQKLYPKSIETKSQVLKPFAEKIQKHISFPLHLSISCTSEVNAFAFPGGAVSVTQGLLEKVKTENGLMFVLGHEIGHFKNRDHLQGLGRQIVLATTLALVGIGSEANQLFNLSQIPIRSFQREQETEADRVGLELLEKIYGHTQGADEFFNYLSSKETDVEKVVAKFASTHPASADRLQFVQKHMAESSSAEGSDIKVINLPEDFYKNIECND
jgi:Zn-dependent protease with chaperone function